MGRLGIQLLGGFLLEWEGRPVQPIASRAGRSLFSYLVAYRDRTHTRDLLAGIFWPDQPESRARRRLSQALWQVQSVLSELPTPEPYLITSASSIGFNTEAAFDLDLERFEDLLDGDGAPGERYEHLLEAVELYRGDFLAGFYDDWVQIEQRRLRERYLVALSQVLTVAKSRGDYESALAFAHRLLLQDPLREQTHVEVMRLSFLVGRTNEALQQFEVLRSILAEELGVEPAPDTLAVFEEISGRKTRGSHSFAAAPESPLFDRGGRVPFVGRSQERAIILDRLEAMMRGSGGLVLVEGEPGVGKSRLLTELADDAHWRGLGVLWGTSTSPTRPYEGIIEALRSELSPLRARQLAHTVEGVWLLELAALLPEIGALFGELPDRVELRPGEEPTRMRLALLNTLRGLGSITPYLLVLDDVHLADAETLAFISALSEELNEFQVLVCLAYRGTEARDRPAAWDTLETLDRAADSSRLVLTPLDEEDTSELIRRSLGLRAVSHEAAQFLYKDTGGNPLFALETLRAIHDREESQARSFLEGGGPPAEVTELPITGSVHDLIASRLARLPERARHAVEISAVIGEEVDLDLVAASSPLNESDALSALDEAIRRGVMTERSGRIRFAHEQIRRVAYRRIEGERRRALHEDVGGGLETLERSSSGARAFHFAEAGRWQKAVGAHLEAASDARQVLAYATAADHYAEAFAHAGEAELSQGLVLDLLLDYESALDVIGQVEEHARVLTVLSELSAGWPEVGWEVELRRARHLANKGDLDAAVVVTGDVAAASRDSALATKALIAQGEYLIWAGQSAEAVPVLRAALAAGSVEPDDSADARIILGRALSDVQEYEAGRVEIEAALAVYRSQGLVRQEAEALGASAIVAMETGDLSGAEAAYRTAIDLAERIGYSRGGAVNRVNLANALYFQGRIGQAFDLYEEAASIFRRLQDRRGEAMVRANLASSRLNTIGDIRRARIDAELAAGYFTEVSDSRGLAQCLEVLATCSRLEGDVGLAQQLLEEGLKKAREAEHRWTELQIRRSLGSLLLDRGETAQALAEINETLALSRQLALTDFEPGLLRLRARAEMAGGNAAKALATIETAFAAGSSGSESHGLWYTKFEVLVDLGRANQARNALEQAHRELHRGLRGLSEEQRRQALDVLPGHRAIVESHLRLEPRHVTRRWAQAGAPVGRALHDDERVEVTLRLPDSPEGGWAGRSVDRRAIVARLIASAADQGASPTVADIADLLHVSPTTVRRDLARLREDGEEVATRGDRSR